MNVNYVKNGKNEFKTTKKIDKSDNRKNNLRYEKNRKF